MHEQLAGDCAAYVLGALSDEEAAALRTHMESCALCREEVARLGVVGDALARGVPPLEAPGELRRRVLDAVEAQAELFAAARAPARPRRRRHWPALRPVAAGAAALAVGLGVAVGALVFSDGTSAPRVVSASVAAPSRWGVAEAPVATLRASGATGELVVRRLPAAPAGKIYEVWIERSDGRLLPTDALFNASAGGTATVAVGNLRDAAAVLVTAERLGGAKVPTMKPLITAQLG